MRHGHEPAKEEVIDASSSVHVLLNPLVEELKCAIATKGDGIKIFPGLEAYANVEHIRACLEPFRSMDLVYRVGASLEAVTRGLDSILEELRVERDEIAELVADFTKMRKILGHHDWSKKRVKAKGRNWIKMLTGRLKRRGLEHNPARLKRQRCGVKVKKETIWQEWIRLYSTHEKGLYVPYSNKKLGFTNNPKELIFGAGRHYYRKIFGRGNVSKHFVVHGAFYCKIRQLHFTESRVREILVEADKNLVELGLDKLHQFNKRTRRTWKIREKDTGYLRELEIRLLLCQKQANFVG